MASPKKVRTAMRKAFPGYYRPTAEECAAKFKECVFSFDANALLNLYRFTSASRDNLVSILAGVKDRVWLSHQAALEYHRNRVTVITDWKIYDELNESLEKQIKALNNQSKTASFLVHSIIEPIRKAHEVAKAALEMKKAEHPDFLKTDPILDSLTRLFDGKVGKPYDGDEEKKKLSEAKRRFDDQIPPGYLNGKKDSNKKYGDIILWFQLLDFAKSDSRPLVFITDDAKDDWWLRTGGRTLGPRPELLQEMHCEANGKWF
jgi:hypothetical protein